MGILGPIKLVKRTREVVIGFDPEGQPVVVTVTAPGLDLIPRINKEIPFPKPPPKRDPDGRVRLRRNARTGELVKNENGQAIPELDHDAPDYLEAIDEAREARTIAMIFACTDFPGATQLQRDQFPDSAAYQLARWKELEDAGVDIGVYRALSDAVVSLGRPMTSGEIEEARVALGVDKATQAEVKAELKEAGKAVPKGK